MPSPSIHLVVGSCIIAASFLLMACLPPRRRIYTLGFIGSLMHLIAVIRFYDRPLSFLLDIPGVVLMCGCGLWALWNGTVQLKKRTA
jgi:hypothetical protein